MPVPAPIGRIHPSEPRAVMIRDPENQDKPHSAVTMTLNIFTDNKKQTDIILDKWQSLVEDFGRSVEDLLAYEEDHA